MTSFQEALKQFHLDEIDLPELEAALERELLEYPERAQELSTALRSLLERGRLANHVHSALQRRIGTTQGIHSPGRGVDGPSFDEDRTRLNTRPTDDQSKSRSSPSNRTGGPSSQPPDVPGDDGTRILTTPSRHTRPSQDDPRSDDRTIVKPGTNNRLTPENSARQPGSPGVTDSRVNASSQSISSYIFDPTAPDDGPPPDVGSVLKGKYRLEERIGTGGMGVVFKARDLLADEAEARNPFVAVKLLNEEVKRNLSALRELQNEVQNTPTHQNVVRINTMERDGGNVFMVMELLDGEELKNVIRKNRNGLPVGDALLIIEGLGAGLAYAHREGVVHSDFKPGNAWLTLNGTPKVLDFGIARAFGGEGEALKAVTSLYASLEMLKDLDPDPRDDIYALACVAYELLTGRHPFDKKSADEAQKLGLKPPPIKGLSSRQNRGLLRGLAFERAHRSPSVEDFLQGIRPLRVQKSLIAASSLGILILVILLGYLLPRYLEQRTLEDLMTVIRTGDATHIERRLAELQQLDPDQLRQVLLPEDVQTRFIDFYTAKVQAAFDPSQERFDYAQAANMVNELKAVAPLSNDLRVRDLQQNTFKRFNDDLNRSIEEGTLIEEQGPRNAMAIVASMAKINPNEDFSVSNLIPDFVIWATEAYNAGNIKLAEALIKKGLVIAPDNGNLINLNAQLQKGIEDTKGKEAIDAAESRLAQLLPNVTQLSDFRSLVPAMQELVDLDSTNSRLRDAIETLKQMLVTETSTLTASRDFDTADGHLNDYASVLPPEAIQPLRDQVAAARATFEREFASLKTEFYQAIDAKRLDTDARDNAIDALAALEKAGAPAPTLSDAWSDLITAFIRSAQSKSVEGQFQSARDILNKALALQPESTLMDKLDSELQNVAALEQASEADRAKIAEAQLEQERRNLKQTLDDFLQKKNLEAGDIETLLNTLRRAEQAQMAAAEEYHSLVVQRVIDQANLLAGLTKFAEALALLDSAQRAEPDETSFPATAEVIRQSQSKETERLVAQQLKDAEEVRDNVLEEALFADRDWLSRLQQAQAGLEKLAGNRDSTGRERIAQAFMKEATRLREDKQLDEAAKRLEIATEYDSENQPVKLALDAVKQELAELKVEQEKAELAARIERLKTSVSADAGAGDAGGAAEAFDELRKVLPENDPYIVDEGPRLIADAFTAMAQDALNKERPEQAGKLADRALSYVPAHAEALKIISELGPLLALLKLKNDFAEAIKKDNLEDAELILKELRSKLPAEDAFATEEDPKMLAKAYVSRGTSALSAGEFDEAELNVDHALALVDDYAPALTLKEKIKNERPRTDEQCGRSELVGAGPRATCRDPLSDGTNGPSNGPSMVVVPVGGAFSRPFAIGKYEITIKEFNHYCRASGECASIQGSTDTAPATGIAIADAERMASWLSEQTGWTYRLPTSAEWLWAAQANGQPQKGDLNCLVGNPGNPTKGAMLRDVRSGDPNGWGLLESVGNAREWAKDGGTLMAHGGARTDRLEACKPELSKSHSGEADEVTGFRFVREIGG